MSRSVAQDGSRRGASRRFLAPEVVQSSTMDCGPAALKSLLGGFGLAISYDRLREACQTDVDGTSIDTLEELAGLLGLDAEQVMLPADHLLRREANALPALVVVREPSGANHFVVVWRRHGRWLQIMDPASGRRWVEIKNFLADLYHHAHSVPASAWRDWAGSDEFLSTLRGRLGDIGVTESAAQEWVAAARADPGWRGLATLDAAVRMTTALVAPGRLKRSDGEALLGAILERGVIPERFWSVRQVSETGEGHDSRLVLSGVVLLRVRGRRVPEDPGVGEELSADLAVAVRRLEVAPLRALFQFFGSAGRWALGLSAVAAILAGIGTVLEVLFFRGLLDLGARLASVEQRGIAIFGLLLFLALLAVVEVNLVRLSLSAGRRLEVRLRLRFLEKIARLGERYFHSRLVSDMAERCHSVHRLRLVGEILGLILRGAFQLLFLVIGISWIDPGSAPWAAMSGAVSLILPLLAQPILAERDLRARSHSGALGRFGLDALLGLSVLRNHGGEKGLQSEHEGLLSQWMLATLSRERVAMLLDLAQSAAGYGFAIWIIGRHWIRGSDPTLLLLLAYWAMNIPMRGQELALLAQRWPQMRNIARRLLEPLRADDE